MTAPRPVRLAALAAAILFFAALARCLLGCAWLRTPAGQAVEQSLTRAGCELVAVLARRAGAAADAAEEVGTLCADLAPAVETELAAMVATGEAPPGALLAHRERTHRHRARLAEHFDGRDPGETIEEGVPLEAALRVLRRRAVDGGGR